jgi:hypothetical protein
MNCFNEVAFAFHTLVLFNSKMKNVFSLNIVVISYLTVFSKTQRVRGVHNGIFSSKI